MAIPLSPMDQIDSMAIKQPVGVKRVQRALELAMLAMRIVLVDLWVVLVQKDPM